MIELSSNIKTKLIGYFILVPLLEGLAFYFIFNSGYIIQDIIISSSVVIGIILGLLSRKRKYLYGIEITESNIQLKYFSSFLVRKIEILELNRIAAIEITKANLITSSKNLNIKHKGVWLEFKVFDKRLVKVLQDNFAAANKVLQ